VAVARIGLAREISASGLDGQEESSMGKAIRCVLIAHLLTLGSTAFGQYTADTAIQSSVLGETRKIDGKTRQPALLTAKQRAFWKDYCTKWPKGGSCDRYRREIKLYPEPPRRDFSSHCN
jgi:hypothetical protein